MTNVQLRSVELLESIIAARYFIDKLNMALEANLMTVDGLRGGEYHDQALIMMWNDMWIGLPDNASIRRQPFFALCDLCEMIYGEDD